MSRADAARLRDAALAYPDAVEEFPWGHTAVKVRGKAFLFLSGEGEGLSVTCKLPASHGAALLLPFAAPTGYGLGKSGWVTASFARGELAPVELLEEWIGESYRAVAPKTLAAQAGGGAAAKEVAKAVKKVAKAGAKKAAKAGAAVKKVAKAGAKKAAKAGVRARVAT